MDKVNVFGFVLFIIGLILAFFIVPDYFMDGFGLIAKSYSIWLDFNFAEYLDSIFLFTQGFIMMLPFVFLIDFGLFLMLI